MEVEGSVIEVEDDDVTKPCPARGSWGCDGAADDAPPPVVMDQGDVGDVTYKPTARVERGGFVELAQQSSLQGGGPGFLLR